MAAYLDLFNDNPSLAPKIAAKYVGYPVVRWNALFQDIRNKLGGSEEAFGDQKDRDREQTKLAQLEPSLSFTIESKKILINYDNINSCTISYYKMDIEHLFSASPFSQQNLNRFLDTIADRKDTISLEKDEHSLSADIPAIYHNANLMIDIRAKGAQQSQAYYSNSLYVQISTNYGQLKVATQHDRRPISKAYVKVYVRTNDDKVEFCKDGYTDIAGLFDYASVSTNKLDSVQRFAILVLSPENGAVVHETAPPAQ